MGRVLIGCEESGVVREAFRELGHDAWSCDLIPARDGSIYHLQQDVREVLGLGWDLGIFHPPCDYMCSSGLHWNKRTPGRAQKTEEALEFVRLLLGSPIPRIALENPVGCIGTRIRKADQTTHPFEFGDDASKRTCLWLKNLPPLAKDPALRVPGRWVEHNGKRVERWANQTNSGQNRLGPSPERAAERARTYPGIARAFAEQWGRLL
jgi:hypothetical protein